MYQVYANHVFENQYTQHDSKVEEYVRYTSNWVVHLLLDKYTIMSKTTKFELYVDKKGHFRWRLLSKNGEPVAAGGEGYVDKRGAMNAVKKLKEWANTNEVSDLTVKKPITKVAKKVVTKAPKKA